MMNVLEKILQNKLKEVAQRRELMPVNLLEQSKLFQRPCFSMKRFIQNPELTGIIAEFKRKSPSKGIINGSANVEQVSKGYVSAGASALSILTDHEFFGGNTQDLINARSLNDCPILRKDFIIDEYQIIEAKSMGADCILLIAAALSPLRIKDLAKFAHDLGLEVLMEVHDGMELETSLNEHLDLVGVNNRSLKTFEVSLETSYDLIKLIPNEFVKISESGLSEAQTLVDLKREGFDGFLIGENFMKTENPANAASDFIQEFRMLLK
jgi:indole-3-glycerol phosphate synthase